MNMSKSTKTPAMVLHEIAIKKGFGPPSYEIIFSRNGTHNNRFDYKVTVGDVEATGQGQSKQISKQEAAYNALRILEQKGVYSPAEINSSEFNKIKTSVTETDGPLRASPNFIGPLKELCTKNRINHPKFTLISDVGPPHQKEFTFECIIDSTKTVATGSTKKNAMQLAAQEMMEKMKEIILNLDEKCPKQEEFIDTAIHNAAVQKYNELVGQIVIDKSVKIIDYPNAIKILMEKFDMTINDFEQDLLERTEDSLKRILDKLELKYVKHKVQDNPVAVSVTLTTNTPFTTMAVAKDEETAWKEALCQVFEILDLYMIM